MKLSEQQKKNLKAIRTQYDDNEMFQRPDKAIGALLNIIATLQQPDTAAVPEPGTTQPSVDTRERLVLRDLVINDCDLVRMGNGYSMTKWAIEIGKVSTETVVSLIDKGLVDNSLTVTALGEAVIAAEVPPDGDGGAA